MSESKPNGGPEPSFLDLLKFPLSIDNGDSDVWGIFDANGREVCYLSRDGNTPLFKDDAGRIVAAFLCAVCNVNVVDMVTERAMAIVERDLVLDLTLCMLEKYKEPERSRSLFTEAFTRMLDEADIEATKKRMEVAKEFFGAARERTNIEAHVNQAYWEDFQEKVAKIARGETI